MSIDIAIVGLAFRFPGCTRDSELDEILERGSRDGRSVLRVPSPERWPFHQFSAGDLSPWHELGPCGFVDRAFEFDHALFSMSPREARVLDPQHRMALELAMQAQEDAGYAGSALAGSQAGVFVGTTRSDYFDSIRDHLGADEYFAPLSNSRAVLSNRISSVFDLRGPSLTIDTLCSSSMVAVHQACRALRGGDCNFAIAGGVNFLMSPQYLAVLRRMGLMSSAGACRPFSRQADGFVPAEGGAMLCLKRLEDALSDGDNVRAVIAGSGIVHHGSSAGLTVPSPDSMASAIKSALGNAGVAPRDIGLLQVMGASNAMGDQAEVDALSMIFDGSDLPAPVPMSCEKGAFGHLEPASGMAGLACAIHALESGKIFPLHGATGTGLGAEHQGLRVVSSAEPWPSNAAKRVGVSSFSMTGTHVHMIVAAPPKMTRDPSSDWLAFPLAGETPEGLADKAAAFADAIEAFDASEIRDAAFTAAVGRRHGRYRAIVVSPNASQIGAGLAEIASGTEILPPGFVMRGEVSDLRLDGTSAVSDDDGNASNNVKFERVAKQYVSGAPVDWRTVQSGYRRRIRLPLTALRSQQFLFDLPSRGEDRKDMPSHSPHAKSVHPMLRNARRS